MSVKKRGVILVVLVLFSITLVSALNINNNEYLTWYAMCYNCDIGYVPETVSCGLVESSPQGNERVRCGFKRAGEDLPLHGEVYISTASVECIDWTAKGLRIISPYSQGCQVAAEEGTRDFPDGCGFKLVPHGFIFSNIEGKKFSNLNNQETTTGPHSWWPSSSITGGGWESGIVTMLNFGVSSYVFDSWLPAINWLYNSPSEFLCSDDSFWHECSEAEADVNSVQWGSDKLYLCQPNEDIPGYYKWVEKGIDQDHDGYIASSTDPSIPIDCADNPSAEGLKTEGCPETPNNCQYPRDSKCAICINPSSPEICGDGVNNDCRGNGREFGAAANELEGATPDSCDAFKEGCEAPSEGYLMDGEEYIDEEGETVSVDERLLRTYGNAQGQQFSWTSTSIGGSCCGYNGINDVGNLNTDSSKICIKNDNELVGVDVPSDQDPDTYTIKDAVTWNEDICQGDWCWRE